MKHNLLTTKISSSVKLHQYVIADLAELPHKIFTDLDLSKDTIRDYQYRIGKFIEFIKLNGFSRNTLLDYKRRLSEIEISFD